MHRVMEVIEKRAAIFQRHPFFRFLSDHSIDTQERLAFVPSVAHYVNTFGDLCRFVFPEEAAGDAFQEIINQTAREDADHYRWFLADLPKLGYDPTLRYTQALEFLWSTETARSRRLSYELCRLIGKHDSIRKFVILHCTEATAEITIRQVVAAGQEWEREHGESLSFFGGTHGEAEDEHTLWEGETLAELTHIRLESARLAELLDVVHACFDAFSAFVDEMLENARTKRALPTKSIASAA